ncbi:MAG: GGDEF domain-containing protein [Vicinamibacteria bacterium]
MERPLQSLFPLITRRFQSFAEASDAALDVLATQVPGEIVLGQIEPGDDRLRVLDVRGASIVGVERGNMLPLAKVQQSNGLGPEVSALEGTAGIDDLDAAHLQSLGLGEWIALPLEMSDGAIVGIVAALSRRQGDYRAEHVVLLGLTARMLAYEWERVHTRTELRELRQRIGAANNADPDTGLPARLAFIDLLKREWKLARRGTVDSMAVCFRVQAGDEKPGSPVAVLALKDAAEALAGAVRSTDQIGRVGDMDLGVAMIGCEDEAGVEALAQRFGHALRRVTHSRPVGVSVTRGAISLAVTTSAEDALEQAERALGGETASVASRVEE